MLSRLGEYWPDWLKALAFKKNSQGWRVVQAEECWHKSVDPLMEEIREQMGTVITLQSWTTTSIYQKNVNIILMNAPYDGGDKGADGNGNTKEP